MSQPVDKTLVQPRKHSNAEGKTVVAGAPGLDQKTAATSPASAREGMILKQRFELVERLGSGGMGTVFKARDLRQVETGDADPWVAVKVINEAFCRHEHALVSLQQETKKTQRLSHPNIVTAYDFDRDGDIAFMTMELLQGQSLDQLLQQNKSGLVPSRALHILRQVTEAVAYAHQQGVVHADLKPANIFITRTGQVKVLDFGIAHAIYAESTALDASALQAFTPAYASCSVLRGEKPRPQDDLYALGCIFYMLFMGQHPFKRCRATEADAAGMKASRISALTRSQWKALVQLLAFHPQSDFTVTQFRQRFFADKSMRSRQLAFAAVAVLLLLITGSLLINWIAHREHRAVIALLSEPDFKSVQKGAGRLGEFDQEDRLVILQGAREPILGNLQQQMQVLKNAEDYYRVEQLFQLLVPLYADSSALQDLQRAFNLSRQQYLSRLGQDIKLVIEQRSYQQRQPDFKTLLSDLKRVDPKHSLFSQYDFKHLLAKEAGLAVYLGQQNLALAIVEQASALYPEDQARFQAILLRQATVAPMSAREPNPSEPGDGQVWLQEYQRAVALAGELKPHMGKEFTEFMQQLRGDNPAMSGVLESSLRRFFQTNSSATPEQLALKKQLLPAKPLVRATRRSDPCSIRYANRGADPGARCRDSLTPTAKGPEMVVIKGSRSVPAFAVSRSEITVADYNHYCRLYRACSARADAGLPLTAISYKQANAYSAWLSKMSGHRYSIPTYEQWQILARDDSGVRDHNCRVFAGGRWIRGGSLRAADEGYQNSLGLLNLFGNAGEWVRNGGELLVVGGDAETEMGQCNSQASVPGAPEGAPLQGFRLVRAID